MVVLLNGCNSILNVYNKFRLHFNRYICIKKTFYFTFGTAALKIKLIIGYGEELVAVEWIVNIVFSRSNVNIMRNPFLSTAVIGGMATKKIRWYWK